MGQLTRVLKAGGRWYVLGALSIAAGITLGYLLFFNVLQAKPQIGIIDMPFTVITENSAFFIGEMLDYAARTNSIKGVVIKLNSPGGGASPSEQLFLKTLKLRKNKPVVVAVGDFAASGGYLMSMGANYIYASPASFVGSVGAVTSIFQPPSPRETLIGTGPSKLTGGSPRDFIRMLEMVKDAFVETVVSQRGEKLKISPDELAEARIYPGMEGVRLGLVDAIGNDTDAIEKAASLAGISRYELVDINSEVLRLFVEKIEGIFAGSQSAEKVWTVADIDSVRRLFPFNVGQDEENPRPGFPTNVTVPEILYLYDIPSELTLVMAAYSVSCSSFHARSIPIVLPR